VPEPTFAIVMEQSLERRPLRGVRRQSGWKPTVQSLVAGTKPYSVVLEFDIAMRICMVKEGLPSKLLTTLAADMHVPRERLYDWTGIARTTANRKVKGNLALSQDESERALGMTRLIGQVERIVAESGNPEGFDAARWTADWLQEPNPALGGRPPGEYMDTADGRELVSRLVARMQSGAYA
jgi:putative toxin-antitoxin system antitoxin component (TIGR02293 family)